MYKNTIQVCKLCKRVHQVMSFGALICDSCNTPKEIYYEFDFNHDEWEKQTDKALLEVKGEQK
jgi:hypothetical protein